MTAAVRSRDRQACGVAGSRFLSILFKLVQDGRPITCQSKATLRHFEFHSHIMERPGSCCSELRFVR